MMEIHINIIMDHLFYTACKKGSVKSIENLVKDDGLMNSGGNYTYGLYYAANNGHKAVCEYLIKNGCNGLNNLNHALCGAILGNKQTIIDYLTELGADWSNSLWYACASGNEKLVKMSINKGQRDYSIGLNGACEFGHLDIALNMIDRDTVQRGKFEWINLKNAFTIACKNNQLNIMIYMYKIGCNECFCGKTILDHFPKPNKEDEKK